MDISMDGSLIETVAMVAREEETSPRVARPMIVSLMASCTQRLQLQTLGRPSFATRAMWQTRRLYSAEGCARS
jgi:hypothetical protein